MIAGERWRVAERDGDVAQPALDGRFCGSRCPPGGALNSSSLHAKRSVSGGGVEAVAHGEVAGRRCAQSGSTDSTVGSRRSRKCGCRSAAAARPGWRPAIRSSGRKCTGGRPLRRGDDRRRRAGVEAAPAVCRSDRRSAGRRAAAGWCRSRRENATNPARQRQGMLAAPGDAGLARELGFHDRCRIGENAAGKGLGRAPFAALSCRRRSASFCSRLPNRLVIVAAKRIARDVGQPAVGEHLLGIGSGVRPVRQAGRNDRAGARAAGPAAPRAARRVWPYNPFRRAGRVPASASATALPPTHRRRRCRSRQSRVPVPRP
jgi:hypothetical protein